MRPQNYFRISQDERVLPEKENYRTGDSGKKQSLVDCGRSLLFCHDNSDHVEREKRTFVQLCVPNAY